MLAGNLITALEAHFKQPAAGVTDGRARFELADGEWLVVLCAGQDTARAHLLAFERAMQDLLEARTQGTEHLALAVDAAAIRRGEQPSYRQALKKYSRSVVFEDVGITLFLVAPDWVIHLAPGQVNSFLSELDSELRKA